MPINCLILFEAFLRFFAERETPVTGTHQLPRRLLPEINARLAHPLALGLQRPQQKSYPHIHGLYLLVRASGLTCLEGTAEKLLPLFEASGGRYGWVSGQLDPRLFTEKQIMYGQADELKALSKNVMIKVPASQQGVDVVRHLTSKGIATNTTTCFTLPQIMAVARAAQEGHEEAKKNKVDVSHWRAVITHMMGRLTEREVIWEQAAYYKVPWTEADRRWLGIGVFKRAYQLLKEGGYPSKMLLCSVRPGPLVNGKMRFWDITELAGDVVFTLPPYALEPMFAMGDLLDFREDSIEEPIPESTIEKIYQMPYTMQAFEPHGMSLDQFNTHPATLYTVKDFTKAVAGVEEFCKGRMQKAGLKV